MYDFLKSLVKKKPLTIAPPTGGILADEMGLGKTVEVLACMMSHPRRDLPTLEELPVVPDEEVVHFDLARNYTQYVKKALAWCKKVPFPSACHI